MAGSISDAETSTSVRASAGAASQEHMTDWLTVSYTAPSADILQSLAAWEGVHTSGSSAPDYLGYPRESFLSCSVSCRTGEQLAKLQAFFQICG